MVKRRVASNPAVLPDSELRTGARMKRRLIATAASLAMSAGIFAGLSAVASPAHADSHLYICLKPVSITIYDPSGRPAAYLIMYVPDGASTSPNACPSGDLPVGA